MIIIVNVRYKNGIGQDLSIIEATILSQKTLVTLFVPIIFFLLSFTYYILRHKEDIVF